MFFLKKGSAPSTVTREVQPVALNQAVRSGSVPSIIGPDVVVNGTVTSTGEIQIDGRVEGDVHGVRLIIGDAGLVRGNILAGDVTVRGRVIGRIRAYRVHLRAASQVEGEILYRTFSVELGAVFEGNCRHSDNPLAEAPQKAVEIKPAVVAPATAVHECPAPGIAPIPRPADGNSLQTHPMPSLPTSAPNFVVLGASG